MKRSYLKERWGRSFVFIIALFLLVVFGLSQPHASEQEVKIPSIKSAQIKPGAFNKSPDITSRIKEPLVSEISTSSAEDINITRVPDESEEFDVEVLDPNVSIRWLEEVISMENISIENGGSEVAAGWEIIHFEGFEGAWPGHWETKDNDSSNGLDYWGNVSCKPGGASSGSWTGWCADEGDSPTCGSHYDDNMQAWMIYGPFSLENSTNAEVEFYYVNDCESCCDKFSYVVSINGTTYYGYKHQGTTSGYPNTWQHRIFDLTNVPTLGDISGQSQVWFAFYFESDYSVNSYSGAYVDDVTIRKYSNGSEADLTPYKPSYWNDKIPIGVIQLSADQDHLYTGPYPSDQVLYFNWGSANQEDDSASGYTVHFEVTGTGGGSWDWTNVDTSPGYWIRLTNDMAIGPLSAGSHTFRLWVDYTDAIDESDESNNYYERTITVGGTGEPDIRIEPTSLNFAQTGKTNFPSVSSGGNNNYSDLEKIGMANPAAFYCIEMGYEYELINQQGICIFPDDSQCDAWDFLIGRCGQNYSYCACNGYDIITETDGQNPFSREYAICVRKIIHKAESGGDEVERIGSVVELMGLVDIIAKNISFVKDATAREVTSDSQLSLDAPPSFDWRNYDGQNWMTDVKNQGTCGSCWAFAAVGTVEARYNIENNSPSLDLDLSEQYLVSDCLAGHDCCGGSSIFALNYIKSDGITYENCLEYEDGTGCYCHEDGICDSSCNYSDTSPPLDFCSDTTCTDRCSDWESRLIKIQQPNSIYYPSRETMKEYITNYGPLSGRIKMGGSFDGDIYRCTDDSGINHAIVLVGYNDTGNVNTSYWIAKNSWGTTWNGDGYFKIGWDDGADYGECSIEQSFIHVDAVAEESTIFTIYNDGNADLEITSMTKRDGVDWLDFNPKAPLTIAAGEAQSVTVTIDWDEVSPGSDDDRIIVYSNDPDESPYPNAVYVFVDKCECTSGPCCDGCAFKSNGSGCDGYSDYYDCNGSNSPSGTNYVRYNNYYCNGTDAECHLNQSNVDTCGVCEYCTPTDPTCNYYNTSTVCSAIDFCSSDDLCGGYMCDGVGHCDNAYGCNDCGDKDCDYLNDYYCEGSSSATGTNYTKYRDHEDCNRPCSSASCQDCSCTSYSDNQVAACGVCKYCSGSGCANYGAGEDCGTDQECDGNGNCVPVGGCTDGETKPCENQNGVCAGSQEVCENGIWPGCDYSSVPGYEPVESTCDDLLDNDCDGEWNCFDSDCNCPELSGYVREDGGEGIPDVQVDVCNYNICYSYNTSNEPGNEGFYSVNVPPSVPGDESTYYQIGTFSDCRYVDEYYEDAVSYSDATLVPVITGQSNVADIYLSEGNTITGTISLPPGHVFTEDVYVNIYASSIETGASRSAQVDRSDGSYCLMLGPASDYKISIWSNTYAGGYYRDDPPDNFTINWIEATPVDISIGNQDGINITLQEGGSVSGTITVCNTEPPEPARDIEVYVVELDRHYGYMLRTDENGFYSMNGLSGRYQVCLNLECPDVYSIENCSEEIDDTSPHVFDTCVSYGRPSEVWVDDDTCPEIGSGTSGDPFCKIQTGVDVVTEHGKVNVMSGIYEPVSVGGECRTGITLEAAGPGASIIDAGDSTEGVSCVEIGSSGVTIEGFTLRNSTSGGGVSVAGESEELVISSVTVKNNIIKNCNGGIVFFNTAGGIIEYNEILHSYTAGILVGGGTAEAIDNQVIENLIYESPIGLLIIYTEPDGHDTEYYRVVGNYLVETQLGIILYNTMGDFIEGNEISYMKIFPQTADELVGMFENIDLTQSYGVTIYDSEVNIIPHNFIFGADVGMFSNGSENEIYYNSFINNGISAEDNGSNNKWDDGSDRGNYWDDYTGDDSNNDGIGDTPYIISGTAGASDDFPIMGESQSSDAPEGSETSVLTSDGSGVDIIPDAGTGGGTVIVTESEGNSHGFTGMEGEKGLEKTMIVNTDIHEGEFFATVRMTYTDQEVIDIGMVEANMRLHHWDSVEGRWVIAGINDVGDTFPTGVLDDYGISTIDNFIWANLDGLSVFSAGEPAVTSTTPSSTTTTASPPPHPPPPPPPPSECTTDEDCDDDGAFCNGDEICSGGRCVSAGNPCEDDDIFCNGEERCNENRDVCTHSGNPCPDDSKPEWDICVEEEGICVECLSDEDCIGSQACNEDNVCIEPPIPCSLSIEPDSAEVVSGQTVSFTVTPEGDCSDPDYEWSVTKDIGSSIDQNGNYVAGTNNDFSNEATDTVTVVDNTNSASAEATVTASYKCFLAKIYGEDSEEVELLRNFRDSVLTETPEGRGLIKLYYQLSPGIVKTMEEDEAFKAEVKEMIDGVLGLIGEETE